ncbi:MAG: Mo-dependent nitrogenase C-terminal domain-containing protein [Thermosynechococcaceae cyanobacterium]
MAISSAKKIHWTQLSIKVPIQKCFAPILSRIEISDRQSAHRICTLIPPACPFERDVVLFGRKLFHIPALCKLNPLYESFVELRFRALTFLADECGEDVTPYC